MNELQIGDMIKDDNGNRYRVIELGSYHPIVRLITDQPNFPLVLTFNYTK
jgi:CO dehydrogenase/acetyl-CoA synthase delta subunit